MREFKAPKMTYKTALAAHMRKKVITIVFLFEFRRGCPESALP